MLLQQCPPPTHTPFSENLFLAYEVISSLKTEDIIQLAYLFSRAKNPASEEWATAIAVAIELRCPTGGKAILN